PRLWAVAAAADGVSGGAPVPGGGGELALLIRWSLAVHQRRRAERRAIDHARALAIEIGDLEIVRPDPAAEIVHHRFGIVGAEHLSVPQGLVRAHRRGVVSDMLVAEAEDVPEFVAQHADLVEAGREIGRID